HPPAPSSALLLRSPRPPTPPLFPYTTLFRSRLAPVKNLGLLLSACAILRTRGLQFRCVLVGDGRCREQLETERDAAELQPACSRSEEHTSELQSRGHLVCRLLLEKKKQIQVH